MSKKLTLSFICSLFVLAAFSQAPTFKDLWGMKAMYLDQEMSKHGYHHIKTEKSGGNSWTYWWNNSKQKCVGAKTTNGKVESIHNTLPFDCNKSTDNSHLNRNTYNHSSHHTNFNQQHNNDRSLKAAFDRGYTDGLYHKSYHNPYPDSSSKYSEYAKGYSSGNDHRAEKTTHHSGRGGYAAHVEVSDLNYQDANFAYSELKNRNFVEQKKHSDGNTTYRVWYNSKTKQCIKTTSVNKRITKIQNSTHCF